MNVFYVGDLTVADNYVTPSVLRVKTQLTQIGAQVEATIKQGAEEANQRIREGFRGIKEKITEVLKSSSR